MRSVATIRLKFRKHRGKTKKIREEFFVTNKIQPIDFYKSIGWSFLVSQINEIFILCYSIGITER